MNSFGYGLAALVAIAGLTGTSTTKADDEEAGTTLTWKGSYESRVGWRDYAFEAMPVRPKEKGAPWQWQIRLMDLDASTPQWVDLTDVVFEGSILEFTYPKAHDELRCILMADGPDYQGECVSKAASTIRNRMILELRHTSASDEARDETDPGPEGKAGTIRDKQE